MAKVYTHNYMAHYNANTHGTECFMEYYTELFEQEASAELEGTVREDVGAVMLYFKDSVEVAYFDYENLVGSVYAMGGTSASYCP